MAKEYKERTRNGKRELYAVFSYKKDGKWKQVWRAADNVADAKDKYQELVKEFGNHGEEAFTSERVTFEQLAAYYEKTYLIEPQYIDGRKVAGLRGYYEQRLFLRTLREHFSKRKLRDIKRGEIERFKAKRLATPTKLGGQRAIASVNRELALLSRMLKVAKTERWLIDNPFGAAGSLISLADEKKRERILTKEEENRLLAACSGRREHIKPIVIMALDTGMRRGEILKLTWAEVDLENKLIYVQAFNTKNMQEKWLGMTPRMYEELSKLHEKGKEGLVFGIKNSVKKAFMTARKMAGLPDVRFHDLRHTAGTRLGKKLAIAEVARILGHTKLDTTYRYVNRTMETVRRAADVLAEYGKEEEGGSVVIN